MKTSVRLIDHPLALHVLSALRDRNTDLTAYRDLTEKITTILTMEASFDFALRERSVKTPLEETTGVSLDEPLVLVPILRAGLGMLNAATKLFPEAGVGYVGLERDESTALARLYYKSLPNLKDKTVLLLDPMLATGGSACHALNTISDLRPRRIKFLSVVSAPEGLERVGREFPDVEVLTVAVDRELNAKNFILPGLGDFGDRLFGSNSDSHL